MKTFRTLFTVLALLSASVVGYANLVTISGTYSPGSNPANPEEPFTILLEIDPTYAPIFVPVGSSVNVPPYGPTQLSGIVDFYLFPVEAITSFSASHGSSPVVTTGTWSGTSWPGGSFTSYLWFNADIRNAGSVAHSIYANLSNPVVSFGFGDFENDGVGIFLVNDAFLGGSAGGGISTFYVAQGAGPRPIPDSGSSIGLLALALAGFAFVRKKMVRFAPGVAA